MRDTEAVLDFIEKQMYGCTIDAVSEGLGISQGRTFAALEALSMDGHLERVGEGWMTIEDAAMNRGVRANEASGYELMDAALASMGYWDGARIEDWNYIDAFSERAAPFLKAFIQARQEGDNEGRTWGRIFAGLYLAALASEKR